MIGDFTAQIGDPSDKAAARVRLTKEQVQENMKTFKEQIGLILDFENTDNPIEFRHNSDWLAPLTFEEIVDIASNFTVQQMIQRDVFERRLQEEKPLFVHEFFYPLMQGYDSVILDADVEVGGTDQTFNMLAGRTLQKRYNNKEKFVVATTLLENPVTGEKLMSKSKGTGVPLDASPVEMFTKIMQLPDQGIIQCFIDCTAVSMEKIKDMQTKVSDGEVSIRELKIHLADTVISALHNETAATEAKQEWEQAFVDQSQAPSDAVVVEISEAENLLELLEKGQVINSRSEGRRLIKNKAVRVLGANEKVISDPNEMISRSTDLKIGKQRFLRIVRK